MASILAGHREEPTRILAGRPLTLALIGLALVVNLIFGIHTVEARRARFTLAPGAAVSDLYPRWLGTRALLFHGQNPYSEAATRQNEAGYYGRLRTPSEAALDSSGYQGFSYPLYTVVLLAPLALLPFSLVQAGATVAFAVAMLWSTLAWCNMVGWPSKGKRRWLVALVAITSLPSVDLLSLQQITAIEIVLITLITLSLSRGQLTLAGVLVALGTIKPQIAVLLVIGLALWTLGDLSRRWRFLAGFGTTMLILFATAFALLPDWLFWFLAQTRIYAAENQLNSPLAILFPTTIAEVLVGALVVAFAVYGFRTPFGYPTTQSGLTWSLGLAVAATLVLLPAAATYNDAFLIFPGIVLGGAASAGLSTASRVLFRSAVALGAIVLVVGDLAYGISLFQPTPLLSLLVQVIGLGYVLLPAPVFAAMAWQQLVIHRHAPPVIAVGLD